MARDAARVGVELESGPLGSRDHAATRHDTPFSIAVFGAFSGNAQSDPTRPRRPLAERMPIRVDRDCLDETMARLAPALHLALDANRTPTNIRFAALDDFLPDTLYERLPHVRAIRDARDPLERPVNGETRPAAPTGVHAGGGLLDQILDQQPPPPGGDPGGSLSRRDTATRDGDDGFAEFVARAVAPHRVAGPNPEVEALLAEADTMIAAELRLVLHHRDFQQLEACWRSIDFLTRRLDTGDMLRMYLFDVTKEELAAGLLDDVGTASSAAVQMVARSADRANDGAPWTLLLGLYDFHPGDADVAMLDRLAALGEAVHAPWIAGASPEMVGASSFTGTPDADEWTATANPEWEALRTLPRARFVGLVAPRVLLRLPHGEESGSSELLAFEECVPETIPPHEHYLWGNGAILCVLVLAEAFARDGWTLRPELLVGHLPLHISRANGEVTALPCAEALLSERALRMMLDRGVMALASRRDSDAVRLARIQSVAAPFATLAGHWTESTHG